LTIRGGFGGELPFLVPLYRFLVSQKKSTMKTLRGVSVTFVAAILVLEGFACQASAGGMSGWGSCGSCAGDSGYGYGGVRVYGGYTILGSGGSAGGYGYGGCGSGGCGMGAVGGSTFWIVGDYTPYIIGHGPMFPAGDFTPAFSYTAYTTPIAPDRSAAPTPSTAPLAPPISPGPSRP
jgi:hypothetical protein